MQEPPTAERERTARDLRSGLPQNALSGLEGEIVFQHIRTGRDPVTLYSMLDGEPIQVPEYQVSGVMAKVDGDNNYLFTNVEKEAPKYIRGQVKCFLHKESVERAAGILEKIGMTGKRCPAGSLASQNSKEVHGEHRHGQEWKALQKFLDTQREDAVIERQEKQLDATLAIARGTTQTDATETCSFDGCDYTGTAAQQRGHKSIHKEA